MPSASEAKQAIRARLRAAPRHRVGGSLRLAEALRGWAGWEHARAVAGFFGLPDEPGVLDPWPEDRRVALPRVAGEFLVMHWVGSPQTLIKGRFGILEPPASDPVAAPTALDLILVPGVAFDRAGGRLGRGRGYYDRFLAATSAIKVGVCFEERLVPEVPCEAHDIRMDAILTPAELILCGRKSIGSDPGCGGHPDPR